ncbi:prevent-host-death protein [Ilyomonas limi]|uniref:Prevent-host-death protein n=1 Tax=Ilyomonas limi TaxID=2575867 RepID=A0A4U3L4F2_9BACT|nr:prevent-host-death protein [Ilyomonas limi]TKK69860.1 prevent-host-death protein [Ilyomonas limi]
MKTMSIGELKTHLLEALKYVEKGEKTGITYCRKKEIKALLVPKDENVPQRKLGILEGKEYFMSDDFNITTEEEFEI